MITEKYIIRGKNWGPRFRLVLAADQEYKGEASSLKSVDILETEYDFFGTRVALSEHIGKEILDISISNNDRDNVQSTRVNLEQHFEGIVPEFKEIKK